MSYKYKNPDMFYVLHSKDTGHPWVYQKQVVSTPMIVLYCILLCPPFKEERAYCFAHVGWFVCLSVTSLFPINNSRTPWPTFFHTSILGSRWLYLFWGHWAKGQGQRVKFVKPFPINNSTTPWPTFFKLGPHIHPG